MDAGSTGDGGVVCAGEVGPGDGRDTTEAWSIVVATPNYDEVKGVTVDGAGDILVVGATSGSLGPAPVAAQDAFIRRLDANGTPTWTDQFGTFTTDGANSVTTNLRGRPVIAGVTAGGLGASNQGGFDGYMRQYSVSVDTPQFSHQLGTTGDEYLFDVGVDSAGNVIGTGSTGGALLGGTHAGLDDAVVAKINGDANRLWIRQYGSAGTERSNGLGIDGDDNIVFAGWTQGNFAATNLGQADVFVMKVASSNGDEIWKQQFGTGSDDRAMAVAMDSGDNVLIGGYVGAEYGCKGAPRSGFVLKLNSGGNRVWFHRFDTSGVLALAVDASDNVLAISYGRVRKLAPDGRVVWTHTIVPPGESVLGQAIAAASDGAAIVGGRFGPVSNQDGFVARLAP
jgi:hypothetical protein